jgi:hypothetical protein
MVPFARSSLVSTHHKLAILHRAAGGRTLVGHLARAQSAEQVAEAFEQGDELFRRMYETLLHQPEKAKTARPLQASSTFALSVACRPVCISDDNGAGEEGH